MPLTGEDMSGNECPRGSCFYNSNGECRHALARRHGNCEFFRRTPTRFEDIKVGELHRPDPEALTVPLLADANVAAERSRIGAQRLGRQGLSNDTVFDEGDAIGDGECRLDLLLDEDHSDATHL